MTARSALTFPPRLLGQAEAAAYLGISATTLRGLPIPRRMLGGRLLYDRIDLDAHASALPYEGEEAGASECDRAFGIGG
jgi:hypothetical protein